MVEILQLETVVLYYSSITCLSQCWVKGRLVCFLLLTQYTRERVRETKGKSPDYAINFWDSFFSFINIVSTKPLGGTYLFVMCRVKKAKLKENVYMHSMYETDRRRG